VYAIHHLQHEKGTWYWSVHFARRGKLYYQRFYEPKYGGSAKARKAAITWRDRQLAKVKILTIREFHEQKRSNNTSGVAGVHFLTTRRQPLGSWQAKITPHDGKAMTKSFSVRKFGRRKAYALAVAARLELLEKVENRPYLYHSVAKRLIRQE